MAWHDYGTWKNGEGYNDFTAGTAVWRDTCARNSLTHQVMKLERKLKQAEHDRLHYKTLANWAVAKLARVWGCSEDAVLKRYERRGL